MSVTPSGSEPARSAAARVVRGTAFVATAEVISKLFALIFFALLAREFGSAILGDYVFALALSSLVWSFAGFGLDRLATRQIARDPQRARVLVLPIIAFKAVVALILTLAAAGALLVFTQGERRAVLVVLVGLNITLTMAAATAHAVFVARERMEYVFVTRVPWAIATAAAGSGALLAGAGIVTTVAIALVGVAVLGALWTFVVLVRQTGPLSFAIGIREWPLLLRQAVPFGLHEILGQVIFRFNTVFLAFVATSAAVGAYGAAFRLLEATLFIPWAIASSAVPMLSYLTAGSTDLQYVFEGCLKLMLFVMTPIAAVLLVAAPAIVEFVYGADQFDQAVDILRLLAPAVAIYGIGHLAGLVVLLRRPGILTIKTSVAVAVTSVATAVVLVPKYGGEGAAVATLIAETMLAIVGLLLAVSVSGRLRTRWIALAPGLAAAVMAGVMAPIADNLAVAIPIGVMAYLATFVALEKGHLREDVVLYRSIAGRQEATAGQLETSCEKVECS